MRRGGSAAVPSFTHPLPAECVHQAAHTPPPPWLWVRVCWRRRCEGSRAAGSPAGLQEVEGEADMGQKTRVG